MEAGMQAYGPPKGTSSGLTNSRGGSSSSEEVEKRNMMAEEDWGIVRAEAGGSSLGGGVGGGGGGVAATKNLGAPPLEDGEAACRLQKMVRKRLLYREKLHRGNLCARMTFERDLLLGTVRMINQGLVFALILIGLSIANTKSVQKGILDSFESAFSLSDIENVDSIEAFVRDTLPSISQQSKRFFPRSSAMFDADPYGHTMLLSDLTSFTGPVATSPFTLIAPEFTVTAWVQATTAFVSGNLARKRVPSTASADLTCWGLGLDAVRGPQFVYGAHDFFPTKPSARPTDPLPIKIVLDGGLRGQETFPAGELVMVTMVVSKSNVTFFLNKQAMNTVALERAFTDCFNGDEGILVGDANLQMGLVQIFPQALAQEKIEELYISGRLLSDIATGSQPEQAQENGLADLGRQAQTIIDGQQLTRDSLSQKSPLDHTLSLALTTAPAPPPPPPDLEWGRIQVNRTSVADHGGREYAELLKGPYRVSAAANTNDNWSRYLANVPAFNGTGATLSYWYRHGVCPEGDVCGGYHFSWYEVTPGASNYSACFGLRIDSDRPYAYNWDHTYTDASTMTRIGETYIPSGFSPQYANAWRHVAFQWNEVTDEVLFFLDGTLFDKKSWGSPVRSADSCGMSGHGEKRVTIGYTLPGHSQPAKIDLYDARMYVHSAAGPLSPTHIRSLAMSAPAPLLPSVCVLPNDQTLRDSDWKDSFGNGCKWYYDHHLSSPNVCQYPQARAECPISCQTRPVCWSELATKPFNAHFLWDRIRKIESKNGQKGAVCLGGGYDRAVLLSECQAWVASGRKGTDKWNAFAENDNMAALNISDCEVLIDAIDGDCDYDAEAVKRFTNESKANGGDWTIAFWVRSTGLNSMHPPRTDIDNEYFAPRIDFLSRLSPPTVQVQASVQGGSYMWQACSDCAPAQHPCHNNHLASPLSSDGWTFMAYSHKGNSQRGLGADKYVSHQDFKIFESQSGDAFCQFDQDSFLNGVVFHQEMLISPVMMIPAALSAMQVQKIYVERVNDMSVRSGPRAAVGQSERMIPVIKNDYGQRSVLMASPIVFQTRHEPTSNCSTDYAKTYIRNQIEKVQEEQCFDPYQCGNLDLVDILGCQGAAVTDNVTLGLDLVTFQSKKGYADFLYSMADIPFLHRDGQIMGLENMLDSKTLTAQVILIFYTPRSGTTSVVLITADFSGHKQADVDVSVRHLEAVEGERLQTYIAITVCNLVLIVFMLVDNIYTIWNLFSKFRKGAVPPLSSALKAFVDLLTSIMVVVFVRMRLPEIIGTGETTKRVLGQLNAIEWESTTVPLLQKKNDFIAAITSLLDTMGQEESINTFCVALLFVYLIRVVQCTSVHPRLALLTGTISKAADDLAHAAILIILLLGLHAGIATWAFGASRHDFRDFEATMRTEFEMMFGNFPDSWGETATMQTFTTLYLILVFLLVQNFLLAIIVEAYMQVREDIGKIKVEHAFWTDVFKTSVGILRSLYYRWPSPAEINAAIGEWEAKFSVSFLDLYATNLFVSGPSLGAFTKHYSTFECCKPIEVCTYAPVSEEDEMLGKVRKIIHNAIDYGSREPTLRDEVVLAQRRSERKKQQRSAASGEIQRNSGSYVTAHDSTGRANAGGSGLRPRGLALAPSIPESPARGTATLLPSGQGQRMGSLAPVCGADVNHLSEGMEALAGRLDELAMRQLRVEEELCQRIDALVQTAQRQREEDRARQVRQHEQLIELLTLQVQQQQQIVRDVSGKPAVQPQGERERPAPQAATLESAGEGGGVSGFLMGLNPFSPKMEATGDGESQRSDAIEVKDTNTKSSTFGIELPFGRTTFAGLAQGQRAEAKSQKEASGDVEKARDDGTVSPGELSLRTFVS